MKKLLEQPNRIYCICGNIEDIICDNSLRIVKFHQLLNDYLKKEAGYDLVVYFLSTRGMRAYDRETALELIASNFSNQEDGEDELEFDNPIPGEAEAEENEGEAKEEEISFGTKIDAERFHGNFEELLFSDTKKSVIVFEEMANYNVANSSTAEESQYDTTLHYWATDVVDNHNLVLMLSKGANYNQKYEQECNDYMRSIFFKESQDGVSVVKECFIEIKTPGLDEIRNLLEHYRLYGNSEEKFFSYDISELKQLAYLLKKYSVLSNESLLEQIHMRLNKQLEQLSAEKYLKLNREVLTRMYPQIEQVKLPMENLKEMAYTENVVDRLRVLEQKRKVEVKAPYQLTRFTGVKQSKGMDFRRFLLTGFEHSNRSKAAGQIVEFLYYIGEIADSNPVRIDVEALKRSREWEMGRLIRNGIEAAKDSVLILDNIDGLLEDENRDQLLEDFHRTFLTELRRNRKLHVIFIVNSSRMEAFFKTYLSEYKIPEQNVLELSKKKAEDADGTEGRINRDGR